MNMVYGQPPKIIWLRVGNQSKAETIKTLVVNQPAIEQALMVDDNDCIEII
jgi:predicted nuclease of predicted toxin-antitoxin system